MAKYVPNAVWTQDIIKDINKKGRSGEYSTKGFGTNRPLPNLDDLMVVPAQLTGPPAVDKYRNHIDTRVVIGEHLPRPLVLEIPIMIAAMSFGAISKPGKMAFAYGASLAGTATNTGEGGALPEEREICSEHGGSLISQYSTGRFGVDIDYLRMGDAIELKIGQGAKPGMGGHLMAEKVTPLISQIRGVPIGTDALSPCGHLDVDSVDDLKKQVMLLREATDHQVPIIIKLGPADVYQDVKTAIELGADAVAIDGAEGGTGCSPSIAIEHAGVPTLGLFGPALRAFEETGARERGVKLIVMGGIRHGADIYKALALGADAVAVASAAMIAIGCIVCQECDLSTCTTDIARHRDEYRLDWKKSGARLANYLKATTDEVKVLTALSGHRRISDLSKDDLVATTYDAAAVTGVKLMGYDRPLPIWNGA